MVLTYSISSFPVLIFQVGMGMRLVNWSHSSAEGSGDQTMDKMWPSCLHTAPLGMEGGGGGAVCRRGSWMTGHKTTTTSEF